MASVPLHGTYWKLVRLGNTPVTATTKQREAHLVFASEKGRVTGSGGCNRVISSFKLDGDLLHFGRMASTQMSCPAGMDQERHVLKALEQVERYRIHGSHLELLDATGAVSLRFEAVALN